MLAVSRGHVSRQTIISAPDKNLERLSGNHFDLETKTFDLETETELKTKTFVLETKIFVLETENLILRYLNLFTNLYFKTSHFLVENCVTLLGQYLVGQ